MSLRWLLPFISLASFAAASAAQPTPGTAPQAVYGAVDKGLYRVSVGGRPVGTEAFTFTIHFDSLYINSEYTQALRGGDTLRKSQMLVVRHFDNDLIYYKSNLSIPGRAEVIRGITVGDTVLTTYRESELGGEGLTHLKPGGRLFALEANAYSLFDLLFRELAIRRGWEQRPVNLLMLGNQDTILTGAARSLGPQTVKWGGTRLEARKFSVTDGRVEIFAWIGPKGYLLRLEQPEMGLIVEREPPPVKRVAKKAAAPKAAPAAKPPSKS